MPLYSQTRAAGAKRQRLLDLFLQAYRRGELNAADSLIHQILQDGSRDPVHLSYAGLLRAIARKEIARGLELCEHAVRIGSYDPVVYRNLARVQLSTNARRQAVATLRNGLRLHPEDTELVAEMRRYEPRRAPILASLGRKHIANRWLGRIATRMGA